MSDETGKLLHSTTDARVWASEWCRIAENLDGERCLVVDSRVIDEGWMTGWFANAIEVGRTAGHAAGKAEAAQVFERAIDGVEDPLHC